MENISFSDWEKIDIRMGKVLSAEKVEGTEKLLKLSVDLGEESPRQLVASIAMNYMPEELVGKSIPVLANLEPKNFRGVESHGMLLAIDLNDDCVLLHPNKEVPAGVKVV
ncbi:MAG: methionine--tRNA ligase subunit beta [Candidatus Aenigmatarchaeota archaeon]